jgi:TM2 domain-containing membrane protein YozV
MSTSRGSTGNVLAAICSFLIPGLGQLVQGRLFTAGIHFVASILIWWITLGMFGWVVRVWSAFSAAIFKPH